MVQKFTNPKKKTLWLQGYWQRVLTWLVIVVLGVATGWFLSSGATLPGRGGSKAPKGVAAPGAEDAAGEAGLADESTFRDSAEGKLERGGINGEGTHHLVREGGESKYVYLTSTVIDLDSFAGKEVQVWGETISGQQAGWLMDVGKIKVVK